MERGTGRGTSKDKLEGLRPIARGMAATEMRAWYRAEGFVMNIIDAPAQDATREWITIRTNRDEDNTETGDQGLKISRMIENRLTELGLQKKITELVRYSRMYNEGGFLYFGVLSDVPQTYPILSEAMPARIKSIDFINVFGPDRVSIRDSATNPLSKYYHKMKYSISGYDVHESRLVHLVRNYLPEEGKGISVIETILDAVKAQSTALWSVTSVLFEMAVWVFKSPDVRDMTPGKVAEVLANMRAVLSSQSSVAIAEDEDMERLQGSGAEKGVKELFDFIFEILAFLSQIPKSRLMGQSQGVITAGQFDLLSYYDGIAKFQELEIRPIIEHVISMVIAEEDGDIYRALNGNIDGLDWEFDFEPLWRLGPLEQAEVDLKTAQRYQIYITTGTLSPTEVKQIEFDDLEEFTDWEQQPLNMSMPELPDPWKQENQEGNGTKTGVADEGEKTGLFSRFFTKGHNV